MGDAAGHLGGDHRPPACSGGTARRSIARPSPTVTAAPPTRPSDRARPEAAEHERRQRGRAPVSSTRSPWCFLVGAGRPGRRCSRFAGYRGLRDAVRAATRGGRTPEAIDFDVLDAPARLAARAGRGRRTTTGAAGGGDPAQRDRGLLAPVRGAGRRGRRRPPGVGDPVGVHPAAAHLGRRRRGRGVPARRCSTARRGSRTTSSTRPPGTRPWRRWPPSTWGWPTGPGACA